MKKYILICCCERDIEEPVLFDTHKEAYEAMLDDYKQMMGYDDDELSEVLNGPYSNAITQFSAYCTNSNLDDVD